MNTLSFVYDNVDVREDIADAHRQTWDALAQAGAFWSDVDRIEICLLYTSPSPRDRG